MTGSAMIKRGSPVEFVSDSEGKLAGHVLDVLPSIENGQAHAVIEIDHELPGILYSVPLDRVSPKAA